MQKSIEEMQMMGGCSGVEGLFRGILVLLVNGTSTKNFCDKFNSGGFFSSTCFMTFDRLSTDMVADS